jgi:hypothetical protein
MNARTREWLKKLGAGATSATAPTGSIPPKLQQRGWPASNPMQQMTGRVGGNQTTAQQTQPLSAQLGGWFGQEMPGGKMDPRAAMMSWLSPVLAQQLSQALGPMMQSWQQSLPQNITSDLLKRRTRLSRRP